MPAEVLIPARFNGPPTSGNGGYSCGVLAAFVDGPARVRLHSPPPLDTTLKVHEADDGAVQMFDGETLVGTAVAAQLDIDIPPAPSLEDSEEAMSRFPCYENHTFETCFVCGPKRPDHDGLELFTGSLASNEDLLASRWQPGADMLDAEGNLRPEILWSALDCPGYFAAMGDNLRPALLGELVGEIYQSTPGDQPYVVYAWPLGSQGRKFYGAAAIATCQGNIVAASHSTWIELKL